jgi:hypothetical protein
VGCAPITCTAWNCVGISQPWCGAAATLRWTSSCKTGCRFEHMAKRRHAFGISQLYMGCWLGAAWMRCRPACAQRPLAHHSTAQRTVLQHSIVCVAVLFSAGTRGNTSLSSLANDPAAHDIVATVCIGAVIIGQPKWRGRIRTTGTHGQGPNILDEPRGILTAVATTTMHVIVQVQQAGVCSPHRQSLQVSCCWWLPP